MARANGLRFRIHLQPWPPVAAGQRITVGRALETIAGADDAPLQDTHYSDAWRHNRMSKPKTISSAQTFIMKFVFPALWISMFGYGTALLWLDAFEGDDGARPPGEMKWMFLTIWIIGTAFILWISFLLKRVQLDDRHIHVSNYRCEISIPLSQIANVTEIRWINLHPVTIHLRRDTEFGKSITFMPTTRFFALWSSHPIVSELTRLSRQATLGNRSESKPPRS